MKNGGNAVRGDARDGAAGDAPHHEGRRCRRGQDVGGDGDQGHRPEREEQQRRHGQLGRKRHRKRHGHAIGEVRSDRDESEACGDGQLEADRADEKRIDEHERGDGEREAPQAGHRPAHRGREQRHPGHRHRPDHRWLPPGRGAEDRQHRRRGGQPRAERETSKTGRGQREGERDVLPGDGEQVGQPCGAEVLHVSRILAAVVAQHDPGEQRSPLGGKAASTADDELPDAIGETSERGPAVTVLSAFDRHPPGEVAGCQPASSHLVESREPPFHRPPLPCCCSPQGSAGRVARGRAIARAVQADVGADAARHVDGIGDEGGDSFEPGTRLDAGVEPGHRALAEQRGEEAGTDDHRRDAEPRQADHRYEHARQRDGRRERDRRTAAHRDGQRDDGAVAHTRTRSRRDASFASPMPRTSRRSSTDAKRPFVLR